jgi:hypothetical protein
MGLIGKLLGKKYAKKDKDIEDDSTKAESNDRKAQKQVLEDEKRSSKKSKSKKYESSLKEIY